MMLAAFSAGLTVGLSIGMFVGAVLVAGITIYWGPGR